MYLTTKKFDLRLGMGIIRNNYVYFALPMQTADVQAFF